MLTLDEQFEAATRELHERLGTMALLPATAVIRRHQRRRGVVTGLAAVAVAAAMVALGVVVTRDVESIEPGSSSVDPVADRLLFPAGTSPGDINEVMLGPDLGNTAKGLASSPSGAPFRVAVAESHGDALNPSLEQRTINGRQFTVESFDGQLVYTTIDNCAFVVVTQAAAGAAPWDSNASKVLEGLEINGRTSTLTLPPGWQSFGAGTPGRLIQLAYKVTIRGVSHNVNLMQITNSPVATVLNLAAAPGPLAATTFNNLPAWTSGSAESGTALIWEDNGNAVSFSGQLTLDELKQLAGEFQHNRADQWARYLPTATIGAPAATSPVQDTMYSSGPTTSTSNACITPPRLTINETP